MEERGRSYNESSGYDVFISYAHLDNYVSKGEGWVTMLHEALELRTAQLLGEEVRIWRDDSLQMNDDFGAEIKDVLSKSHILVSIVTPRYIRSTWCQKELDTFVEMHNKEGSSKTLGNKRRLFKVVKTPIDRDREPPSFHDVIGVNFYKKGTSPPQELIPSYQYENTTDEGRQAINKLAYAIKDLLARLKIKHEAPDKPSRGNIYIAATASDLEAYRNKLICELEDRGYTILPKVDFPTTISEITGLMKQDLPNALCSIHLVGDKYGFIPEDSERSIVELQVDEAFEYNRTNQMFSQFIWLSEQEGKGKSKQQEFRKKVAYLEMEEGQGDIIRNSFENFKPVLEEKLEALHQSSTSVESKKETESHSVYVIHTREDRRKVKGILLYLKKRGVDVSWPVFDGSEENILKTNNDQLQNAEGVLIFWGEGSEAWFIKQRNNIKEQINSKELKGLRSLGVILSSPENDDKTFFLDVEDEKSCMAKIICSFDEFSPGSLDGFLEPLISNNSRGEHD